MKFAVSIYFGNSVSLRLVNLPKLDAVEREVGPV